MKSILIVDDDAMSRMFAELIVRPTGANILKAENGLKAVETVKAGHEIDVILMDMSMPVMNGFEATRIIKSLNKKIPVIALTSLNLEKQKKKIMDAGCDIVLHKPVEKEDLQNAIQQTINNGNYESHSGFSA